MAGTFRAAVFGANDGLVSNLALILGIAATGTSNAMVIATGIAGLLAGALSMAAGEYISVTSQRELLEASNPSPDVPRQVGKLNVRQNELELVFRARGDSPEESAEHAQILLEAINRPANELTTGSLVTSRSFLGANDRNVDLDDSFAEIGHPWQAGVSSFFFFAIGALLPLIPFLFGLSGMTGVIVSQWWLDWRFYSRMNCWPCQVTADAARRQLAIGWRGSGDIYSGCVCSAAV